MSFPTGGRLTLGDFALGAVRLVERAAKYNVQAPLIGGRCVDLRVLAVPEAPYCETGPVYLRFNSGPIEVFYSAPFQVPILYLSPDEYRCCSEGGAANPLDTMITCTEHPITGLPTLYLHPCQTAALMAERLPTDPLDYMIKWIGAYQALIPVLRNALLPADFFRESEEE